LSDIKIFRLTDSSPQELEGRSVSLEKSLQTLIERHLETFLGVRFLATELYTGRVHKGFIDTLGIDENHCPVIIEYKRSTNENVINQGLFYLDWLMDHKAEFKLLVMERLGREEAEAIEWTGPRLLCIAGDFNRYDEHAVQQINRNIELVRYRKYGDELLLFELVNAVSAQSVAEEKPKSIAAKEKGEKKGHGRRSNKTKTVSDYYNQANPVVRDRFESLKSYLMALGDDVQMKTLKYYFAFKRIKNFACVEIHPWYERITLFVKVNPDSIRLEGGFTTDVRSIGHFGTGDLRIDIKSMDDLEKAKPLLLRSYESS